MKISSKLFAIAVASIISSGAVMADGIGQDLIYGTQAQAQVPTMDFSKLPATAAGSVSDKSMMNEKHSAMTDNHGDSAIPDYLEGLYSHQ